jgi:hypothetical protein
VSDIRSEERGAVAIIVALFLVALLVLVALVVDLGNLYDHDRELQTAADAGVLAGAQELFYSKGNLGAAETVTRTYVQNNAAPLSSVVYDNVEYELLEVTNRSVEVHLREDGVPFSFAPVIGRTQGTVRAKARAELMYLTGMPGLFPIALPYTHPHHFKIIYGGGGDQDTLVNPNWYTDDDMGLYQTSPVTETFSLSPGLNSVSLIAQDQNNQDQYSWPDIGSIYVPPTGSPIASVRVTREIYVPQYPDDVTANLSETLTVRIVATDPVTGLPIAESKAEIQVQIANKKYDLALTDQGGGVFVGSLDLPTPSFTNGMATVTLKTKAPNNSPFPSGVTIGSYTWYERGYSLVYASWNSTSSAGGTVDVTAEVQTKVFKFGYPIMLKPALANEGTYQGNDFWASVIVQQTLKTELEVAVGVQEFNPAWGLEPDVGAGGNNNGMIDIGEYLPYDNGVSVGHWNWLDDWFATYQANNPGKPLMIYMPIVDPGDKKTGWRIQAFAAFNIFEISGDGNRISIVGQFDRWIASGDWTSEKPPSGLYVETAVLTK